MTRNVPAAPGPPEKGAPPKRITKTIRAAVDALVHGDAKSITEAAAKAGLSRSHLSRELGKQHITAFLRDKVLRNLAVNSAKADARRFSYWTARAKWSAIELPAHLGLGGDFAGGCRRSAFSRCTQRIFNRPHRAQIVADWSFSELEPVERPF